MLIIPNRRKDRILVRLTEFEAIPWKVLQDLDARPCKPMPTPSPGDLRAFIAQERWPRTMRRVDQPLMLSIPVTTRTKVEMARKLRKRGAEGTIKWGRGTRY